MYSSRKSAELERGPISALRRVASSQRRRCVVFHTFYITCPIRPLRRRARSFNGSTDKRRSGRGVMRCVVGAPLRRRTVMHC
ncbi:unnamed protein product [Leptosia nina]|uniref:Uncharacterized protein n=1 Tax=Leptosia nina TaxID=320188 RepID=A0AAV1IV30_9NEOP